MWVKICGVTEVANAGAVVEAGADAVGLNFYRPSKRFVHPATAGTGTHGSLESLSASEFESLTEHARMICNAIADGVEVVGVFVNASANTVVKIVEAVGLTAVQFHGDESSDLIAAFHAACPAINIIRAFRIGKQGTSAMDAQLMELQELGVPVFAVLVDALVDGEFGGTGHRVDAAVLRESSVFNEKRGRDSLVQSTRRAVPVNDSRPLFSAPRLILAGGLTPDNVAGAVADVQPWGVDTASGVESTAGLKDVDLVRQFVTSARNGGG